MSRIQRALISVTDKTGVVDFARALSSLGVEVLSEGSNHGLKEGLDLVWPMKGFANSLDGRSKTSIRRTYHDCVPNGEMALFQ